MKASASLFRRTVAASVLLTLVVSSGMADWNEYFQSAVWSARTTWGSVHEIDLQRFFSKRIGRLCIQGPYMSQGYFEELAGVTVRDYVLCSDVQFRMWIIFEDGSSLQGREVLPVWFDSEHMPWRSEGSRLRLVNFGDPHRSAIRLVWP